MKTFIKVVIVFIVSFYLTGTVIYSINCRTKETICYKQTYPLTFIFNGDTIETNACHYNTRVFSLNSEDLFFYYCEHTSDTTHIKRLLPIDQHNFVKVIKYK